MHAISEIQYKAKTGGLLTRLIHGVGRRNKKRTQSHRAVTIWGNTPESALLHPVTLRDHLVSRTYPGRKHAASYPVMPIELMEFVRDKLEVTHKVKHVNFLNEKMSIYSFYSAIRSSHRKRLLDTSG